MEIIKEESIGSNTDLSSHCERSSDTEASSSCNLEPTRKRTRKVLRKMKNPLPLDYAEYSGTINLLSDDVKLDEPGTQQLLEVAVAFAARAPKDLSAPLFTVFDCQTIAQTLRDKHQICFSDIRVSKILDVLYYQFEEYCKAMKKGKVGLIFNWESGELCRNTSMGGDNEMGKFDGFMSLYKQVILNFHYLKSMYLCAWEKYFKEGAQPSSTWRSRSTQSVKFQSHSSVNTDGYFVKVLNRIKTFLGVKGDGCLPEDYVRAIEKHYMDERICVLFMLYDDEAALRKFLDKVEMVRATNHQPVQPTL